MVTDGGLFPPRGHRSPGRLRDLTLASLFDTVYHGRDSSALYFMPLYIVLLHNSVTSCFCTVYKNTMHNFHFFDVISDYVKTASPCLLSPCRQKLSMCLTFETQYSSPLTTISLKHNFSHIPRTLCNFTALNIAVLHTNRWAF